MPKKIHVIVNPVSGQPQPIIQTLNSVFTKYDVDWDLSITKQSNVREITQKAMDRGAEVIAVYGGDGTISEVASVLKDTDVALGLLPGGTANVLSCELMVPRDLKRAAVLLCTEHQDIMECDMGQIQDKYFMLRVGVGFEAETMKGARRDSKTKLGWLAYVFSGFRGRA